MRLQGWYRQAENRPVWVYHSDEGRAPENQVKQPASKRTEIDAGERKSPG